MLTILFSVILLFAVGMIIFKLIVFLFKAADAYISRLEGSDLTYEDVPKKEEVRYITREDLE